LSRADEQLDSLMGELREYADGNPCTTTREPKQGSDGWFVLRYEDVKPLDPRYAVILGEIVHDLRSALDHVVHEMVRLSGRCPYSGNYFPIYPFETITEGGDGPSWERKAKS